MQWKSTGLRVLNGHSTTPRQSVPSGMAKPWDMEDRLDKMRGERTSGDRKNQERERLSWREKDRRKDGSSSADSGGQAKNPSSKDRYANAAAQKALKGELEDLFRDHTGDSLKVGILQADRGSLQGAIDAYIEAKGGLPADDSEVLDKCLDARRDKTLRLVVAAIAEGIEGYTPDARKVLLLKIRAKARRSFDATLGKQMKALLAEHGVED